MPDSAAISAYATRAAEYTEKLGSMDAVPGEYHQTIAEWAANCPGKILDVGCGPGHLTQYLRSLGHEVEGIDPVNEFVRIAQSRFPESHFRQADAENLGVGDCEIGGILSWYSLIHMNPEYIDGALKEFLRAICPGGGLLVGFFEWPALEPFDHKVTTAYRWPVGELASRIERAGLLIENTTTTRPLDTRPHATITARKPAGPGSVPL